MMKRSSSVVKKDPLHVEKQKLPMFADENTKKVIKKYLEKTVGQVDNY
jgi:hypothetical protein